MSHNLTIWQQLCRTDPKATKDFNRSGFKGTQIDPVWRYQKMTEVFGPIGKGWGYEQVGAPIITDGMVFVCVRAWWRDADGTQHYTGEQWGGDVLFKPRREGNPVPNDEALKMATTDAVGKALVLLGLGADVHMGQFDESKYREEVNREYRAKENGNGNAPAPDTRAYEHALAERLVKASSEAELDLIWRAEGATIKAFDRPTFERIVSMFKDRKAEIQARSENTVLAAG